MQPNCHFDHSRDTYCNFYLLQTLAPSELSSHIGSQEQIDAILKAFHRLPGQELQRLEIDLTQPVIAGTPEAETLFKSWKLRQAELKEAMKNILQPAEYMTNITRTLNGTASPKVLQTIGLVAPDATLAESADVVPTELSADDKVYLLRQLESLLDDVDNARDFHTIGAWPTLLTFLRPTQPLAVRTVAAWAVGSAVKNTYDYQLWALESIDSVQADQTVPAVTCLELLVGALATPPGDDADPSEQLQRYELQKRVLYALSSAMRGNMDVQDAILRMPVPSDDNAATVEVQYIYHLHKLAREYTTTPAELLRKVWAAAADLLEERSYIRRELAHEVRMIQAAIANANATGTGIDAAAVQQQADTARTLQEATLLGDHLISAEWMRAAAGVAQQYAQTLSEVEAQIRGMRAASAATATGAAALAADTTATATDAQAAAPPAVAAVVEPTLQNSEQVAMHATLRSLFAFFKETLADSPQLYDPTPESADWQGALQGAVRHVQDIGVFDKEGAYEALLQSAQELAVLIGLLDQGANSAVF